jgi:predicted metal-dependent phosphoesterase TrpH
VLIDLHCHTAPRSTCSSLRPEELADAARAAGLDAICLTEHDAFWPESELEDLRRRTGFKVFGAIELTSDIGHLLAFGLPRDCGPLATAAAAYAVAQTAGALLYLAHPARDGLLRVTAEVVRCCASVEAANGSDSRLKNLAASGLASGFALPGIGGSDCHRLGEVATAATEFEQPVANQADLVAALHGGRYRAVML